MSQTEPSRAELARVPALVLYIVEFHTQPYTSLLYIAVLEHNLLSKFRLVSSMVYIKFQIVCMQEREELRAFEREKRCQEREK
jgi:hypothetical protein